MTATHSPRRRLLLRWLPVCLLLAVAAGLAMKFYGPSVEEPDNTVAGPSPTEVEPAAAVVEPPPDDGMAYRKRASGEVMRPQEGTMVSLPDYVIEPPDVLQIEMLKQVPLPPYRAQIYDVLQIQVLGTLLDQPIGPKDANGGFYLVEPEGTVNLGPAYGTVRVVRMTIDQIKAAIDRHLRQVLKHPQVAVELARASGMQPVTGEYLVGPDGTLNLRQYGTVQVGGKTVADAKAALEKHLSQYFDSPEAAVTVLVYNSKIYYIITEGPNLGDNIVRVPITGNETVLDAFSQVGGLSQLSSKNIWIARPAPDNLACEQVLPIDYEAITRGASTGTNYQILPGDRVFIVDDPEDSGWFDRFRAAASRLIDFF